MRSELSTTPFIANQLWWSQKEGAGQRGFGVSVGVYNLHVHSKLHPTDTFLVLKRVSDACQSLEQIRPIRTTKTVPCGKKKEKGLRVTAMFGAQARA